MVLVTTPRTISTGPLTATWVTIDEGSLFNAQRQERGTAEAALRGAAASAGALLGGKKETGPPFRIVTSIKPITEVATGSSEEEIAEDMQLLRCFVAGVPLEDDSLIPPSVRKVIADVADEAAKELLAAPRNDDKQELVKQIEPWAVTLLEQSDRLRYVCYAMKIAASCGADFATLGLGGEEVVQLAFTAVDSAVLSSWLAWFTSSLLDESGSGVVRQLLQLDFGGGPRQVVAEMDAICSGMLETDVSFVTRAALKIQQRVAVLVGDCCSLLIPKDFAVGGAVITELLIRKRPVEAAQALRQLVAFYEVIPERHRGILEETEQLSDLLTCASGCVRSKVMSEYERPLSHKAVRAAGRAVICAPMPILGVANLASSAAISANVGKESCSACFNTIDEKMPVVATTLQKSLTLAFGTLALLAHCADRAASSSSSSGFSALDALKALPVVEKTSKAGASGVPGRMVGAAGAALGTLGKMVPGGTNKLTL